MAVKENFLYSLVGHFDKNVSHPRGSSRRATEFGILRAAATRENDRRAARQLSAVRGTRNRNLTADPLRLTVRAGSSRAGRGRRRVGCGGQESQNPHLPSPVKITGEAPGAESYV